MDAKLISSILAEVPSEDVETRMAIRTVLNVDGYNHPTMPSKEKEKIEALEKVIAFLLKNTWEKLTKLTKLETVEARYFTAGSALAYGFPIYTKSFEETDLLAAFIKEANTFSYPGFNVEMGQRFGVEVERFTLHKNMAAMIILVQPYLTKKPSKTAPDRIDHSQVQLVSVTFHHEDMRSGE